MVFCPTAIRAFIPSVAVSKASTSKLPNWKLKVSRKKTKNRRQPSQGRKNRNLRFHEIHDQSSPSNPSKKKFKPLLTKRNSSVTHLLEVWKDDAVNLKAHKDIQVNQDGHEEAARPSSTSIEYKTSENSATKDISTSGESANHQKSPARFADDFAIDVFRSFFSGESPKRRLQSEAQTDEPAPTLPSRQEQEQALESLILSQKSPSSPPEELRSALSDLVGFSDLFSSRRLALVPKNQINQAFRRQRSVDDPRRNLPPHAEHGEDDLTHAQRLDTRNESFVHPRGITNEDLDKRLKLRPLQFYDDRQLTHSPQLETGRPPKTMVLNDAVKLNVIHARYRHFLSHPDVRTVVDIGAGSGAWSLFAGYKLARNRNAAHHPEFRTLPSQSQKHKMPERAKSHKKYAMDKTGARKSNMSLSRIYNLQEFGMRERNIEVLQGKDKIVAVDTKEIPFVHGVQRVHGDFMNPETIKLLDAALVGETASSVVYPVAEAKEQMEQGKIPRPPRVPLQMVDVVLSDMIPEGSGDKMMDAAQSLDMCRSVWEFAKCRLKTEEQIGRNGSGVLLMRHVAHPLLARFRTSVLAPHFKAVKYINPQGVWCDDKLRVGSYFICWGYKGPEAVKWKSWT